mmetsp:Transcript_6316/g.7964  ORF Transcript_6316/g.7964 Transcript_6316/m.7964 type:complete len:172 (-) Transcript_6316:162-677(-)
MVPYKLRVFVDIDKKRKNVWIRDNCVGFSEEHFPKLVSGIGESIKLGVPWLNGQFGFGFQAFRAAAGYLDCFSTQKGFDGIRHLRIGRDQTLDISPPSIVTLEKLETENKLVSEAIKSGLFSQSNGSLLTCLGAKSKNAKELYGTAVCLSEFDPVWFESVTGRAICEEIER